MALTPILNKISYKFNILLFFIAHIEIKNKNVKIKDIIHTMIYFNMMQIKRIIDVSPYQQQAELLYQPTKSQTQILINTFEQVMMQYFSLYFHQIKEDTQEQKKGNQFKKIKNSIMEKLRALQNSPLFENTSFKPLFISDKNHIYLDSNQTVFTLSHLPILYPTTNTWYIYSNNLQEHILNFLRTTKTQQVIMVTIVKQAKIGHMYAILLQKEPNTLRLFLLDSLSPFRNNDSLIIQNQEIPTQCQISERFQHFLLNTLLPITKKTECSHLTIHLNTHAINIQNNNQGCDTFLYQVLSKMTSIDLFMQEVNQNLLYLSTPNIQKTAVHCSTHPLEFKKNTSLICSVTTGIHPILFQYIESPDVLTHTFHQQKNNQKTLATYRRLQKTAIKYTTIPRKDIPSATQTIPFNVKLIQNQTKKTIQLFCDYADQFLLEQGVKNIDFVDKFKALRKQMRQTLRTILNR